MPLIIAIVFALTCQLLLPLFSFNNQDPAIRVTAQPGFVSIDCGSLTDYTDDQTKLSWTSDSHGFGLENVSHTANVNSAAKYTWLQSMRIFDGNQSKYCYEFGYGTYGIVQSYPYLVRASFWTGDVPPFSSVTDERIRFRLLINANEWDSIDISLPQNEPLVKEMYVTTVLPTALSVCVASEHGETAFISSLELRPISKSLYSVNHFIEQMSIAFFLYSRVDLGSAHDVRFPNDKYDRIWSADTRQNYLLTPTPHTQSTAKVFYNDDEAEAPPSAVLQTALVDDSSFNITFDGFSRSYEFSYLLCYAEISSNVTANERSFHVDSITACGCVWGSDDMKLAADGNDLEFSYNRDLAKVDEGGFLTFSFERNSTSLLGPLVNGLEILYSSPGPMSLGTDDHDVTIIQSIKGKLLRFDSWRGDPCLNISYEWLTCDFNTRPHIIKLTLPNKGITGEIPAEIGDLTALVELNLQGNNLSGSIPESIAQLPNLTTLFLQNNNLSGPIPQALLRLNVNLRLEGNPNLCKDSNTAYCFQQHVQTKVNGESKKRYVLLVVVLASSCALVLFLVAFVYVFYIRRKSKKDGAIAITHTEVIKYSNLAQTFTSQQIERMTNDFKTKLGTGGFGDVFFGTLSTGLNVAVKVSSCHRGAQDCVEFLNEVALLSRVHHRNLVQFVGYCIQPRLVLVYDYMAKGSLADYLHGKDKVLSWRDRLKIIVGAAKGLEYLHKGCKPPIIHRDVKCSNILLDEELEGKISDFGISRSKLSADTHVAVTNVQGTVGYMAPEYAEFRISVKTDIFAFGVVLLEVVSGRRPLVAGSDHIVHWVRPLLNKGQIRSIADPRMAGDYGMPSMWKVVEVAMACVEDDPQWRPDTSEVSSELESALLFELQNETVATTHSSSYAPFDDENVVLR